jgi:hypothetical protein
LLARWLPASVGDKYSGVHNPLHPFHPLAADPGSGYAITLFPPTLTQMHWSKANGCVFIRVISVPSHFPLEISTESIFFKSSRRSNHQSNIRITVALDAIVVVPSVPPTSRQRQIRARIALSNRRDSGSCSLTTWVGVAHHVLTLSLQNIKGPDLVRGGVLSAMRVLSS